MHRSIGLLLSLAFAACGQSPRILGPFSAATNHAADLRGTPDNRPTTWGTAEAHEAKIEFHPPVGYRVRILRVYGDFQGWMRKNPSGNCVGVLWGLSSTGDGGSQRVAPAGDNVFLYVQDSICGQEHRTFRAPIDFDVKSGGLLNPDNLLISKVAVWLNETGEPVHMEPSFVVVYRFEKP